MTYIKVTPPDIKPVAGRKVRHNTKPTKKIKDFYAKTLDNVTVMEPDKAIRKAVEEVYTPQASTDLITSQTGLQILVKEMDKIGLTTANDAYRFKQGVDHEDKSIAVRYEGLVARLKYPEAFRANVNIDNRSVNVSSVTDQELDERIKQLSEAIKR